MDKYATLYKKLGVKFSNETLLATALTHRSYLNEHRTHPTPSNERLEFLGDAVLQLLTSEHLYRLFPESPEGDLTGFRAALVCTKSLAEEALKLNFGDHLLLSKGEEESGGRTRPYILANTFEAFLGALYLDQQLEACRDFLKKSLFLNIDDIVENGKYRDFKSVFQELSQQEAGVTPIYKVRKEWGPDHAKNFEVGTYLKDKLIGVGSGASKQKAEEEAAKDALDKWAKK